MGQEKDSKQEGYDVTIRTDVDQLVKLVEEKKEIALGDAAEILKIPKQTLEAWADYLEEEGVILIRYKLTTPYLVSVEFPEESLKPEQLKSKKLVHDLEEKEPEIEDFLPQMSEQINKLLQKAYDYIDQGEYEKAHQIYLKVKEKQKGLPDDVHSVQRDFDVKLTKLNKDLSINIKSAHLKKVNHMMGKLNSRIRVMQGALLKNDLKSAEEIYEELQDIFSEFPESYTIKRAEAKISILDAYEKMVHKKHEILSTYVQARSEKILNIVSEIQNDLDKKNLEQAFKKYNHARNLYNLLPETYTKNRVELDRKFFGLIPQLVVAKLQMTVSIAESGKKKIQELVSAIDSCLKKGDLDTADKYIGSLEDTYEKMPQFVGPEWDAVESKITTLKIRILQLKKDKLLNEVSQDVERIRTLLKKADTYLEKQNIDLARGVYHEVLNLYREIPVGFIDEQTNLQVQILKLYKELLVSSEEKIVEEYGEQVDRKYRQLVTALVEVREALDEGEFQMLPVKYKTIVTLLGQLPFSLVKRKDTIEREVAKIEDLSRLLKTVEQAKTGGDMAEARKLYQEVAGKYPHETRFLNYAKSIIGHSSAKTPDLRKKALVKNLLGQADTNLRKGNTKDARTLYNRVLSIENTNQHAHDKLEKIKEVVQNPEK